MTTRKGLEIIFSEYFMDRDIMVRRYLVKFDGRDYGSIYSEDDMNGTVVWVRHIFDGGYYPTQIDAAIARIISHVSPTVR